MQVKDGEPIDGNLAFFGWIIVFAGFLRRWIWSWDGSSTFVNVPFNFAALILAS